MKTIYIKKYCDNESDIEYIEPSDVFKYYPETSDKGQYFYTFLLKMKDYVEYYNNHTSTAFGNPDLAKMDGIILGWCLGANWQIEESKKEIKILSKGGRLIMLIERPKKSLAETEKRKELKQMWNEILG